MRRPEARSLDRRVTLAVFVGCWIGYLAAGLYLTVDQQFIFGDALARVHSAQSVLFSRDPHLSAIGFIFTPLTAIVQLPRIALSPWIPAMTADALSAVIMSSGFMAGAVTMVAGIGRDRGTPRALSAVVIAAFAVNPMIVLYAANGMSEAPATFFTLWAVRALIRWVDSDDVHDLIIAAIAFAFAFLTRYDLGAAAALSAAAVAVISHRRDPDATEHSAAARSRYIRRQRAVIDGGLVLLPSVVAFMVWAITSWIITGELLAQFTSEYGNSAIIAASGGSGSATASTALVFSATEMLILAPLVPILLSAVVVIRYRQRRLYPLVLALAATVAVLMFQTVAYSRGMTFGFLRFYLSIIPMAAVVALLAVPARKPVPWRRLGRHAALPPTPEFPASPRLAAGFGAFAGAAMLVGLPVTALGMTSPKHAPQEFAIASVVHRQPDSVDQVYLDARKVARSFSTERELAQYLDALNLPEGAVLTDTVYGFAVVARSNNPKQFVIPSDHDFNRILNDPARFDVQYLLAVPNTGRGRTDALNVRYPTLYENGATINALVLEAPNQGMDLPNWRIYRVRPQR